MSKSDKKLKAISLRRGGNSIKDIAKELGVSRGSVSVWCQDIKLTKAQQEKLFAKQIASGSVGRQKGADVNREKRLKALEFCAKEANKNIKSISDRELFFLGLGIYWGEGIKSRSGPAAVVNSDVYILKTMKRWFCDCLGVDKNDFRPYVYISDLHKNREHMIMNYWAKELELPMNQFKTPIYLSNRPKQKYENHDNYYGVVALRVTKSTNLKYKIMANFEAIKMRLE